jgi:hypothetical protein
MSTPQITTNANTCIFVNPLSPFFQQSTNFLINVAMQLYIRTSGIDSGRGGLKKSCETADCGVSKIGLLHLSADGDRGSQHITQSELCMVPPQVNSVPDKDPGCCPDPGISGTG